MAPTEFDPVTGEVLNETQALDVPDLAPMESDDPLSLRMSEDDEEDLRAMLSGDTSDPFPQEEDEDGEDPAAAAESAGNGADDGEGEAEEVEALDGEVDEEPDLYGDLPPNPLSLETLFGDTRDALVSRFRNTRKPWEQMNEQEQQEVIEAFSMTAKHIIRGVVGLMTDYEFPRAVVTLGQVNIKDRKTIEAKIVCQNIEEYRTTLGEAVGNDMILLAVDSDTFMASRGDYPTKGTQIDMGF